MTAQPPCEGRFSPCDFRMLRESGRDSNNRGGGHLVSWGKGDPAHWAPAVCESPSEGAPFFHTLQETDDIVRRPALPSAFSLRELFLSRHVESSLPAAAFSPGPPTTLQSDHCHLLSNECLFDNQPVSLELKNLSVPCCRIVSRIKGSHPGGRTFHNLKRLIQWKSVVVWPAVSSGAWHVLPGVRSLF